MDFITDHFIGTIVNFVAVLVLGILGALIKKGVPKRLADTVMSATAICVIYIGIDGVLAPAPAVAPDSFINANLFKVLVMIISMAVGSLIGELIDLDKQLGRFGDFLGAKFERVLGKESGVDDAGAKFAKGFVSCSLILCVGAMSVNGAILDAQGEPGMLFAKSILDGITAFVMATTLGIGCAFSAFAVLIYQGSFNVIGLLLAEAVSADTISYMSMTGSLIIILLGMNVLGITRIKTANMVPAMFVAIGAEALLKWIFGA